MGRQTTDSTHYAETQEHSILQSKPVPIQIYESLIREGTLVGCNVFHT